MDEDSVKLIPFIVVIVLMFGFRFLALIIGTWLGFLFGLPVVLFRRLLRNLFDYDFLDGAKSLSDEDGLVYNGLAGFIISILTTLLIIIGNVIIKNLPQTMAIVLVVTGLFFSGNITFFIISKMFKLKKTRGYILKAVFGNLVLIPIMLIIWRIYISIPDYILFFKNLF